MKETEFKEESVSSDAPYAPLLQVDSVKMAASTTALPRALQIALLLMINGRRDEAIQMLTMSPEAAAELRALDPDMTERLTANAAGAAARQALRQAFDVPFYKPALARQSWFDRDYAAQELDPRFGLEPQMIIADAYSHLMSEAMCGIKAILDLEETFLSYQNSAYPRQFDGVTVNERNRLTYLQNLYEWERARFLARYVAVPGENNEFRVILPPTVDPARVYIKDVVKLLFQAYTGKIMDSFDGVYFNSIIPLTMTGWLGPSGAIAYGNNAGPVLDAAGVPRFVIPYLGNIATDSDPLAGYAGPTYPVHTVETNNFEPGAGDAEGTNDYPTHLKSIWTGHNDRPTGAAVADASWDYAHSGFPNTHEINWISHEDLNLNDVLADVPASWAFAQAYDDIASVSDDPASSPLYTHRGYGNIDPNTWTGGFAANPHLAANVIAPAGDYLRDREHITISDFQSIRGWEMNVMELLRMGELLSAQFDPSVVSLISAGGLITDVTKPADMANLSGTYMDQIYNMVEREFAYNANPRNFPHPGHAGPYERPFEQVVLNGAVQQPTNSLLYRYWYQAYFSPEECADFLQIYGGPNPALLTTLGFVSITALTDGGLIDTDMVARTVGATASQRLKAEGVAVLPAGVSDAAAVAGSMVSENGRNLAYLMDLYNFSLGGRPAFDGGYLPSFDLLICAEDVILDPTQGAWTHSGIVAYNVGRSLVCTQATTDSSGLLTPEGTAELDMLPAGELSDDYTTATLPQPDLVDVWNGPVMVCEANSTDEYYSDGNGSHSLKGKQLGWLNTKTNLGAADVPVAGALGVSVTCPGLFFHPPGLQLATGLNPEETFHTPHCFGGVGTYGRPEFINYRRVGPADEKVFWIEYDDLKYGVSNFALPLTGIDGYNTNNNAWITDTWLDDLTVQVVIGGVATTEFVNTDAIFMFLSKMHEIGFTNYTLVGTVFTGAGLVSQGLVPGGPQDESFISHSDRQINPAVGLGGRFAGIEGYYQPTARGRYNLDTGAYTTLTAAAGSIVPDVIAALNDDSVSRDRHMRAYWYNYWVEHADLATNMDAATAAVLAEVTVADTIAGYNGWFNTTHDLANAVAFSGGDKRIVTACQSPEFLMADRPEIRPKFRPERGLFDMSVIAGQSLLLHTTREGVWDAGLPPAITRACAALRIPYFGVPQLRKTFLFFQHLPEASLTDVMLEGASLLSPLTLAGDRTKATVGVYNAQKNRVPELIPAAKSFNEMIVTTGAHHSRGLLTLENLRAMQQAMQLRRL